MKEVAFWDIKLFDSLLESENLEVYLSDLLDTFEVAKTNGATIKCCEDIYNYCINNIFFGDWLYNKKFAPEFADIKRELSIHLSRSLPIELDEYNELIKVIDQSTSSNELILCFSFSEDNILFIHAPDNYWYAKQWFLSNFISKDKFIEEAKKCFPNLFFHDDVTTSFHTLNADFNFIKTIIVKHLQSLNNYYNESTCRFNSGVSFRQIASEIQSLYKIECSPQANRDSVQKLFFDFYNTETTNEETLCCELHTKLKWDNMDREKQDRIYFHPGKRHIQDGKILVVYIGTHI